MVLATTTQRHKVLPSDNQLLLKNRILIAFCVTAVALFLQCNSSLGQVYTVETVPNTKLVNNSYVSDPAGLLNAYTVSEINGLLDSLEKKATAQVAVVMLPSIGDADRFEFAQALFRKWGIGQSGKDNGLLILFIEDQRNIRFHTGYGLEGVLPDAICKRIQQDFMVPHFKNADYNTGMREGIKEVYRRLTSPEAVAEIYDDGGAPETRNWFVLVGFLWMVTAFVMFFVAWGYKKFKQSAPTLRILIPVWQWLLLYAAIPLAFFMVAYEADIHPGLFFGALYTLATLFLVERYSRVQQLAQPVLARRKFQEVYGFLIRQRAYWKVASVFFPIPVWFLARKLNEQAHDYRNRPRNCVKCGAVTTKLSEQQEDEFLQSGQQAEEKIGAVDYDVWKCSSCGAVELLSYPNEKARYTACPKCRFVTYQHTGKRELEAATYASSGRGEEEFVCLHCGFVHLIPFVIPMLVASSSSDSSSSSSDSGGSWGGGDSGGGGADSSW